MTALAQKAVTDLEELPGSDLVRDLSEVRAGIDALSERGLIALNKGRLDIVRSILEIRLPLLAESVERLILSRGDRTLPPGGANRVRP